MHELRIKRLPILEIKHVKSLFIFYVPSTHSVGEEEAIYSWAAINFLKGDLLSESKGVGPATGGKEGTFGTLDLGGASSQIAFYVKNQGWLMN